MAKVMVHVKLMVDLTQYDEVVVDVFGTEWFLQS